MMCNVIGGASIIIALIAVPLRQDRVTQNFLESNHPSEILLKTMKSAFEPSGMQINFHWGLDELQGR